MKYLYRRKLITYVIINKLPPMIIGYLNVYIIFFILAFKILKMILFIQIKYDKL